MQRLNIRSEVRLIYGSLGVKRFRREEKVMYKYRLLDKIFDIEEKYKE
jgi:uncharacterized protein (DUF1499 family)